MRTTIAFSLVGLIACGGGEPPPKPPEPVRAEPPAARRPALQMKSELGSVDPGQVKLGFSALNDQFTECQKRGILRVPVLSGNVTFFVRIAEDGAAKWAYLEESAIGDRETEKCLLAAVLGARWPKADGGEAEARYTMELPLLATRPPSDWSAEKVAGALAKHGEAIGKCKVGVNGKFRATMYVGPGGRVLSAGVATSNNEGDAKIDCLAKVLEQMKGLPTPGSWPAKVSFAL